MIRLSGDMASLRYQLVLLALFYYAVSCRAGPVGPFPNVTSVDMGLKEGSCALGDVVYVSGDDFSGSDPCEKCKCTDGEVQCLKQQCEPRPGCKALHRPDHCCPTYQCECEQEGRVYGNGEKLVDPVDPCRVCYCQGGEVVCRRIACFLRDDCTPRLVPGRCCPEYDNCPVRGVSSLPPSLPSKISSIEEIKSNAGYSPPRENIKQEITIKEITPVSEIPAITEVKIKEILPSPSIEVAEYSSSKSPLIPREATSEKNTKNEFDLLKTEAPTIIEVHPSHNDEIVKPEVVDNGNDDATPSKISFSTQDSINSDIYPSNVPIIASPSAIPEALPVATTAKPSIIEEEDPSLFDHNPAFPPLPDDLSVLSNHGDEIVPEPFSDFDHVHGHDIGVHSIPTEAKIEEHLTTASREISNNPETTEKEIETSTKFEGKINTESFISTESPTLNLRSAISSEMLNVPSYITQDIIGQSDDSSTTGEPVYSSVIPNINNKVETISPTDSEIPIEAQSTTYTASDVSETDRLQEISPSDTNSTNNEQTTSLVAKSNVATEVTSQTELSSLAIETSDQKPHETDLPAKDSKMSTSDPFFTSSRISSPGSEVITVSKPTSDNDYSFENTETTAIILTPLRSSETATDSVELIKISGDQDKKAAIIENPAERTNNVLKELINLVSDVASISDHTETPELVPVTGSTVISDSEELIPVNMGYKKKNNSNQNSITEIPMKSKNSNVNKQNILEIEDEDPEHITDSASPNDKVEPTTRRPIIDNVSDKKPEKKVGNKDIEIITQSYVPTINRRPTKVVMKNDIESSPKIPDIAPVTSSTEIITENINVSSEIATEIQDLLSTESTAQ